MRSRCILSSVVAKPKTPTPSAAPRTKSDFFGMPQCFVSSCGNYYGKTRGNPRIIYHMFPSSSVLAVRWTEACRGRRGQRPPPHTRVCSNHFSAECYQRDLQHELLGLPLRKKLKPDAVPNINLPKQPVSRTLRPSNEINDHRTVADANPNHEKYKPRKKIPMRSSIRIAKRRSIQSLDDKVSRCSKNSVENTASKLKFMAKLRLKYEANINKVGSEFPKAISEVPVSAYEFKCSTKNYLHTYR